MKYDIVKENTVLKYSECLHFFYLIGRKHLVHVKRGTISDKVDLHWVELKYVDSYVMEVDLEVDLFE